MYLLDISQHLSKLGDGICTVLLHGAEMHMLVMFLLHRCFSFKVLSEQLPATVITVHNGATLQASTRKQPNAREK